MSRAVSRTTKAMTAQNNYAWTLFNICQLFINKTSVMREKILRSTLFDEIAWLKRSKFPKFIEKRGFKN